MLYYNRFVGKCAAGDQFSYGWFALSARSLDDAANAAAAWNSTLWNGVPGGTGWQSKVSDNVEMLNVIVTEIDQPTGKQLARADRTQDIPGTNVGAPLPADCALVVSTRTALPQRSGRGRFYLPQPASTEITGTGTVQIALITDILNALDAAFATYNDPVNYPVLYSRKNRTVLPIISYNIGDLFDTQRRRENKLTENRISRPMPT